MKILGTRSVLKRSYFLHTLLQQKCHGRHNHGSGSLIDTKGDAGKFWKEGAGWKGGHLLRFQVADFCIKYLGVLFLMNSDDS